MAEVTQKQGGQPLKFTITHYRLPHHTHEAFIKWLTEEHLPLALPVLKKHGALGYSLFITPGALNDGVRELYKELRPTWDVADYDCVIEYILPDMQTIQNVMSDPDWQVSVKDQDQWVDVPKAVVSLGHHVPYLVEGEVLNMPK
ncbi:hypothetical protein PG994_007675 [Apiospora phragmitis]|uniref:EthD domain-containing protein n=1 Tax=Apiospora phragmitis TaxID=2905665 RepID=A0ABR1UU10_9PEZI